MKLRIQQKALAEAATWAARQVPGKPLQPVYAGLRIAADTDSVTVSGTDGETSTHSRVLAAVITPGVVVVAARLLAPIVASLPDGIIELHSEGSEMVVTADGTEMVLATLPIVDYPTLPSMPDPVGIVPGDLFAQAVTDIAHLADPNVGAMPTLAGIRLTADRDELMLCATDRYRVGYRAIPWQPTGVPFDTAVVPARALAEIAKGASGDLRLALPGPDNLLAGIDTGHRTTITRVLDAGQFPKVDRVIPTNYAAEAEVQAEDLLAAVRRIGLVAEDKTPVRLEFTSDRLTLAGAQGDLARGTTRLDCQLEGPDRFRVSFNPRYLVDGLQAIAGPVRIALTNAVKPVLFTSVDNEAVRYLTVPLKDDWSAAA